MSDIDTFVRWAQSPVTVADALGVEHVVEFYMGPDWYQLRHVVGKRFPEHRFRWAETRGDGWSTWRASDSRLMSLCRQLPAVQVSVSEAERDPLTRWKTVDISVRHLPIRPDGLSHPYDEASRTAELESALADCLSVTKPDPKVHPSVYATWERGRAVLAQRGRWRDVDGDPIRAVAERVLADRGRDGLPPHTRLDAEAIARWVIGKTRPVPGTST